MEIYETLLAIYDQPNATILSFTMIANTLSRNVTSVSVSNTLGFPVKQLLHLEFIQ